MIIQWIKSLFLKEPDFRFRILIVCRANITRSPFVAGTLRKLIDERYPEAAPEIGIGSAGVQGFHRAAADAVMRFVAQQHGVDLLPHASRPVSAKLVRSADLVLTLEESYAREICVRFQETDGKVFPLLAFGNSDLTTTEWDVPDPTGKEAEEYDLFADLAVNEVERVLHLLEGQILNARQNVILIGNPGAGKSTIGKRMAEELGWTFLDTDDMIKEEQGTSLQDIVDQEGHLALRTIEESVLLELDVSQSVIATGGSAVHSTEAMTHLRRIGILIWLDADPEVLLKRIGSGENRGLAKPAEQSVEELLEERTPLYRRWGEVKVSTDEGEEACVDAILDFLTEKAGFGLNIEHSTSNTEC